MTKDFITCLDNIIALEETSLIQEKTAEALEEQIEKLGIPHPISAPVKQETYLPNISYKIHDTSIDTSAWMDIFYSVFGIGSIIGAIHYLLTSDEMIIFKIIGAIFEGAIWGVISAAIALVGWAIFKISRSLFRSTKNKISKNAAEKEAHTMYLKQYAENEKKYTYDLQKHEKIVAFDKKRVAIELQQKEELKKAREQLLVKHTETKNLLDRFYDVADIYITYRNIVAMYHISEYLKSGICTQLTGHNGAFMVFKYEMYEKLKIERLDTIIEKLDQLHFDNIELNNSLKRIEHRVSDLINEVHDMNLSQKEAAYKNEQLLKNINSSINDYGERISEQKAIIAYNEECTANEIKQLKWLNYYNSVKNEN